MHLTGLLGMPRRVHTYSPDLGLEWLNLVSTVGGFVFAVGVVAVAIDVLAHFLVGHKSPRNPWKAGTLEWAMPMPPPTYNFASIPVVGEREPLWAQPDLHERIDHGELLLADPTGNRREILATSVLAARPEYVIVLSQSTWIPLLAALAVGLVLALFLLGAYAFSALALVPLVALLVAWAWSTGERRATGAVEVGRGLSLPLHHACRQSPGWWGTVLFVLLDGALFASLVYAYFYLWLGAPAWPPEGAVLAAWPLPVLAAGLLAASGWAMHVALRANRGGARGRFTAALATAMLLALASALVQGVLLAGETTPQLHAYASVVHVLVGFHLLHVLVALLIGAVALARARDGLLDAARPLEAEVCAVFWQATIAQGLVVLAVVHLFARSL
jgi:cytochrome c oxidase subunit I+III